MRSQNVPSPEAARRQLDKILISKHFAGSERMRRFLAYVVGQTLNGEQAGLKEYSIGTEVFDRSSSYDPRVDSIVRVEARRLRSKLRAYYSAEGLLDPVVIGLPEGSYIPTIESKGTAPVQPPERAASNNAALADNRPSIAVLPFVSLSADPENEYFADGLTDELIHALSRLDQLRVVARTSAFQYKGRPHDIRTIGSELRVGAILEGSVRKSEGRLRVTAQLVNALDGFELWSGQYDRELANVFAVQAELAHAITQRMRVRISGEKSPGVSTVPIDAYQFFLEGKYFASRMTPVNLRRGIESLLRALMIEPAFAAAHAALGSCYCLLMLYGDQNSQELAPLARSAVSEALRLEPESSAAYCWLGFLQAAHDWDFAAAERSFLSALALSPSYAEAAYWYGALVLGPLGRMEEAREKFDFALKLDPHSLVTNSAMGLMLYLDGHLEAAARQLRKTMDLDPMFYGGRRLLAAALLRQGDFDEAVKLLEEALPLAATDPRIQSALGFTLGYAGREAEAMKIAADLESEAKVRYISPYDRAMVQLGLAHFEKACELLEQSADERRVWVVMLRIDPVFDELRAMPRFQALVHRVFANAPK